MMLFGVERTEVGGRNYSVRWAQRHSKRLLQTPGPKALIRVPTSRLNVLGSSDLSGKVPLLRGKVNIPDSKKIEGVSAGRLIDECGLKGTKIGGAMTTHRHANIFVNADDATPADVCALIQHARETVERETGYRLETEIDFIGEFSSPTEAEPAVAPKDPELVSAEERANQA